MASGSEAVAAGGPQAFTEVAAEAQLSHSFLSQVERGLERLSMTSLFRVAQALGTIAVALFWRRVLLLPATVGTFFGVLTCVDKLQSERLLQQTAARARAYTDAKAEVTQRLNDHQAELARTRKAREWAARKKRHHAVDKSSVEAATSGSALAS